MRKGYLYEQIITSLKRRLEEGLLLPGEKAPSLGDLRREFKVGMVTATRALQELQAMGLLERRPGNGYFVKAPSREGLLHREMVGCLLRSNYVSPNDHYFDEIICGIQQAAFRGRVNLLWSHLAAQFCASWCDLSRENLVSAALEMNNLVGGYLLDERISDETARAILTRTGKPVVIVNRATTLPVFSVSPNYRWAMRDLLGTLQRMGYNRFLLAASGVDAFSQREKELGFSLALTELGIPLKNAAVLPQCMMREMGESYREFRRLWKEFSPGRLVVISAVDSFSSLLIKCLEKDGFSVPRDLGVVSTDGLEAYAGSPNPISSLKIPTVEMGEKALSLLLGEIRQRREIPVQNFQLNSTMFFGTTL